MYITPTVTGCSNGKPVRPSWSVACPDSGKSARFNSWKISSSRAPSNTGDATCTPASALAASL